MTKATCEDCGKPLGATGPRCYDCGGESDRGEPISPKGWQAELGVWYRTLRRRASEVTADDD